MVKAEYVFEDFLESVDKDFKDFVGKVHGALLKNDYKPKIESKASGLFISYAHPKTKRSILNFLFRKKGLLVRIYGDNCNKYEDLINRLPENMVKQIDKAGVCKRLVDPQACNSKCALGYGFYIGEKRYQKCRNSSFYFDVDVESAPFLLRMIEGEIAGRG
jgi:hypothetical protein